MKLIRMIKFNELTVEDVEIPCLNSGEALIKTKYVGICGSDIHIFEGKHPTARPPMVLGHEFYGELVEIKGDNVNGFKPGDRVSGHPLTSCGYCEFCMSGRENLCKDLAIYGVHRDGCYAEYVKVAAERLVYLNPDIDEDVCALLEPFAVAVHDVRRSGFQMGDTVFILGAGTIGIHIAILAEFSGAGKILLVDIDNKRIAFAKDLGFSAINALDKDYDKRVEELSGGSGFKRVFEVSGTQAGWSNMTKAVSAGGTIVLVGIPNQQFEVDVVSVVLKEIDLKGVRIHSYNNFRTAAEIISSGKLTTKLKKLVSRHYSVNDVQKAFEDVEQDKSIVKALIKFF